MNQVNTTVGPPTNGDAETANKSAALRRETIEVAVQQASTVIKALGFFNGGALFGILTFIAQSGLLKPESAKAEAVLRVDFGQIVNSLGLFGAGAVVALACTFSNFMVAGMHAEVDYNSGYDSSRGVRLAGIWVALFSFFLFGCGVWAAVAALHPNVFGGRPG